MTFCKSACRACPSCAKRHQTGIPISVMPKTARLSRSSCSMPRRKACCHLSSGMRRETSHLSSRRGSVKKLFINLLDLNGFLHAATDVIANHQPCQQVTINQHDTLAQKFGGFLRCRRETRRCDEQALAGLEPVQRAKEIAYVAGNNL